MINKVLVWHQGAMGDLLLSLPALYAIRNSTAATRVHLVSRTDLSGLILHNSLADEISSNEDGLFADLFAAKKQLPASLGNFLPGFNTAFIFMKNPVPCFLEHIRDHVRNLFFIHTTPPPEQRVHISDYQMGQLKNAGIVRGGQMPALKALPGPSLVLPPAKIITLHPGSGGKKKCWPLSAYLELVSLLNTHDRFFFYFILGPAEENGEYEIINDFITENNLDAGIVRDKPLSHVAALLEKTFLYVGNDSGMTHLSSALGTFVVAIFGPTDHKIWAPRGNVKIVDAGLACPTRGEMCGPCTDIRCLKELKAQDVLLHGITDPQQTGTHGSYRK